MNKFRMVKAGINVNQGLARLSGDINLYEELLIQFLDDTHFSEMKDAIAKQDVNAAFQASHALKGVAGNLSMTKLYDAIVPIVEVFRAGSLDVGDLSAAEEEYKKVCAAIEDMKGSKEA